MGRIRAARLLRGARRGGRPPSGLLLRGLPSEAPPPAGRSRPRRPWRRPAEPPKLPWLLPLRPRARRAEATAPTPTAAESGGTLGAAVPPPRRAGEEALRPRRLRARPGLVRAHLCLSCLHLARQTGRELMCRAVWRRLPIQRPKTVRQESRKTRRRRLTGDGDIIIGKGERARSQPRGDTSTTGSTRGIARRRIVSTGAGARPLRRLLQALLQALLLLLLLLLGVLLAPQPAPAYPSPSTAARSLRRPATGAVAICQWSPALRLALRPPGHHLRSGDQPRSPHKGSHRADTMQGRQLVLCPQCHRAVVHQSGIGVIPTRCRRRRQPRYRILRPLRRPLRHQALGAVSLRPPTTTTPPTHSLSSSSTRINSSTSSSNSTRSDSSTCSCSSHP
mmetsp:Transcript_120563/g.384947  ORF Transcript_120563/g.384947 Transcript_120563/m.384947 type:complete len:392 (+) Transcript_120563:3465-4640(+)